MEQLDCCRPAFCRFECCSHPHAALISVEKIFPVSIALQLERPAIQWAKPQNPADRRETKPPAAEPERWPAYPGSGVIKQLKFFLNYFFGRAAILIKI
jgi:hypothetical protein